MKTRIWAGQINQIIKHNLKDLFKWPHIPNNMPFTFTASARETAQRLDPLQHYVQNVFDRLGYAEFEGMKNNDDQIKDVRAGTLMICKADITSNILVLNFLAGMNEGIMPESNLRMIIGLTDQTIPLSSVVERLSQYLRLAFVTMFQFRVENMIVNILNVINANHVTRTYYINAKNLLNMISIDKRDNILDILMILQNIRNSLYSNGVHNNRKLTSMIDECKFDFQRGQPVNCASWAHIVIVVKAIIDVLEKILNAPEVKAILPPIIDHYIEQD
jgi:hypothetical protein